MKEERLLKVFSEIDEKYVEEASPVKRAHSKTLLNRWGIATACLLLLCAATVPVLTRKQDEPAAEEQELFVPVASLLTAGNQDILELASAFGKIPIGQYTGIYEKVRSVESEVLAESRGGSVPGAEEWYSVSGHADMQYLIRNDHETYSLWKFAYFDSEEYPYCDVLELVYRIDSADAILEIEVNPARMDNTDEGKAIQERIGTHTITDREKINTLYEILSSLTCYGSNHWDMIDYGAADAPADSKFSSHKSVWSGRCLSIVTDYGNEIDSLKYTAVSDMFYEFSGVGYNRLTEEQAADVCEIIGIAANGEESVKEANPGILTSDPAQEIFLLKATNITASLEYVAELQSRVSSAMINHELPFVTSSSVYEDPYRLHIVVTSDAEDDLQKLIDLDTAGGVLEIKYAERGNILQ